MAVIDLDLDPSPRVLRVFGSGALVAFGVLAYVSATLWHLPRGLGWAFAAVALLSGLFALVRPAWNRPLYVGLSLAAYPIGFVLSYVVLGVIFFVVLTPVGLVFRLIGRDPLRRRRPSGVSTYWVPRSGATPAERYFRQF